MRDGRRWQRQRRRRILVSPAECGYAFGLPCSVHHFVSQSRCIFYSTLSLGQVWEVFTALCLVFSCLSVCFSFVALLAWETTLTQSNQQLRVPVKYSTVYTNWAAAIREKLCAAIQMSLISDLLLSFLKGRHDELTSVGGPPFEYVPPSLLACLLAPYLDTLCTFTSI